MKIIDCPAIYVVYLQQKGSVCRQAGSSCFGFCDSCGCCVFYFLFYLFFFLYFFLSSQIEHSIYMHLYCGYVLTVRKMHSFFKHNCVTDRDCYKLLCSLFSDLKLLLLQFLFIHIHVCALIVIKHCLNQSKILTADWSTDEQFVRVWSIL